VSSATERDDFDPYRVWLGIPKAEQPPNHYRLLGITLFEDDPQVILEGADRQVAHLKTKQTGQRVAISQKLLQQVAAAAGCLLDTDSKAKYDATLRESLQPAEKPLAEIPKEAKSPAVKPVLPVAQLLVHSPPAYSPPPQPVYVPAPAYVPPPVPAAPVYTRPQPIPARPIPVAPKIEEPTDEFPSQISVPTLSSHAVHSSRSRHASGDLVKWLVGGGIAAVMLLVAWSVLSRSDVAGALSSNQPRPPKPTSPRSTPATSIKPVPATKPATIPETQPAPATGTNEPGSINTVLPATPSTPMPTTPIPMAPANTDPLPTPMPPATVDPPTPKPPTPGDNKPPIAVPSSPNQPAAKVPRQKKLWRHTGGLIELDDDGTWKELSPAGDYHTLTLISQSPAPAGDEGEVWEFQRTTGSARLRVHDDRLEMAEGAAGTFVDIGPGGWVVPADELELETWQRAGLERACDVYADSLAKAHRKLIDKFDNLMSSSRKRVGKAEEWLATVAVLEAEKKRFEDTGFVPWSLPIRGATAEYLTELSRARTTAEGTLDKIASQYVIKKQPEIASSVLALKQRTIAPLVVAKLTKVSVPRPNANPNFGGFRRPQDSAPNEPDDLPPEERTGVLRLWSNGVINHAGGKSQWSYNNVNLLLKIVRPTFTLTDQIKIAEPGNEFAGQSVYSNDYKQNFTGKFEFVLEPQERRPKVRFRPLAKGTE
jgi:hypothetical protein